MHRVPNPQCCTSPRDLCLKCKLTAALITRNQQQLRRQAARPLIPPTMNYGQEEAEPQVQEEMTARDYYGPLVMPLSKPKTTTTRTAPARSFFGAQPTTNVDRKKNVLRMPRLDYSKPA